MAENSPQTPAASPFRRAFYRGLVIQTIFIILAALVLDGGDTLRMEAPFAISYFVMVLWIDHNRPEKPTSGDLFFIQSFPFFSVITAFFGGWLVNSVSFWLLMPL